MDHTKNEENVRTEDESGAPIVSSDTPYPLGAKAETVRCHSRDGVITSNTDTASYLLAWFWAVFIGFDTEWGRHPTRKLVNVVLSYALHLICGAKSIRIFIRPKGPERKHRLSLNRLLGLAIQKAIEQGVLTEWPTKVYLAMHYGRGDLAARSDFARLRPQLTGMRGTLATGSRAAALDIDIDEKSGEPIDSLPVVPPVRFVQAIDRSGNSHGLRAHILDTFNIAPGGGSLDALGKLLGEKKLVLPAGYDPSDMPRFLAERPEEFAAYNLQDAKVPALYARRFAEFCTRELGLSRPPATLGAAAVAVFLRDLKAQGLDRSQFLGLKTVKTLSYSRARQRRRTRREEMPIFARNLIELVAADAYSGGRTETYMTGPVTADE